MEAQGCEARPERAIAWEVLWRKARACSTASHALPTEYGANPTNFKPAISAVHRVQTTIGHLPQRTESANIVVARERGIYAFP